MAEASEDAKPCGDWLYWIDSSGAVDSGVIQRMNLTSRVVETLKTGLFLPQSIAVDPSHQKMYWTENDPSIAGRIFRAKLDGSQTETILRGTAIRRSLRLDVHGGHLYWCGIDGAIMRSELDGASAITLVTAQRPFDLALDFRTRKFYWTEYSTGQIRRANLDGTNVELIVSTGERPFGITLDTVHRKIYWIEQRPIPWIRRSNLDGSHIEDVITQGLSNLAFITSHGGVIYWTSGAGVDGKIQKLGHHGIEDAVTGLHSPFGLDYVAG